MNGNAVRGIVGKHRRGQLFKQKHGVQFAPVLLNIRLMIFIQLQGHAVVFALQSAIKSQITL